MTRTALAPTLSRHLAEPFLQIHPADAAALDLQPADLAHLRSPTGSAILRVLISPDAAEGAPFAPMHWTAETAPAARIGPLIAAETDPVSGQPESKASVVAIERFDAEWFGFAVSVEKPRPQTRYWARMRAANGWRTELASDTVPGDWADFAKKLFGLGGAPEQMTDAARRLTRLAFSHEGTLQAALFVSPDPVVVAREYLAASIGIEVSHPLAARPGTDRPDPGPTVCSCMNVGRNTILSAIEDTATLEGVCDSTGAGSGCGSCRPEIADLVRRFSVREAAE